MKTILSILALAAGWVAARALDKVPDVGAAPRKAPATQDPRSVPAEGESVLVAGPERATIQPGVYRAEPFSMMVVVPRSMDEGIEKLLPATTHKVQQIKPELRLAPVSRESVR